VGKSSVVLRFIDNMFTENLSTVVGLDFKLRTLDIGGTTVKLQVWDTAGQERFRTITSSYYRGAHGVIVMYDITSKESFTNVNKWLQEVSRYSSDTMQKIVIGNKTDLDSQRQVPTAKTYSYASQDFDVVEVSAKNGNGIDEAFILLANKIKDKLDA